MNFIDLETKVSSIRTQVTRVYDEINQCKSPLLPPKDKELIAIGEQLSKELYDVVVCGEVKKGKSSFINSIIGEALLPVNTEVATSQVFRIVSSDKEFYELVFVDGSRKKISKDDLAKYGSQVAADENGYPEFEKAIDYIEIHYPIAFLPKSIAIVDTPGIGAVYADHERITRRYLKNAAAVIFITDPQNPITEPERAFVESALNITSQMVFVMTKMDNYDSEYIVNMIRRNEEILLPLAKHVQNGRITMLPMSSKILADAANNNNEVLRNLDIISSQFDKVREAMLTMIYTVVGLGDNVEYTNQMIAYNSRVMSVIKENIETLNDDRKAKQLLEEKRRLQKEFASKWGPNSSMYKEVEQSIADESNSIFNKISVVCGPTGYVYRRFQKEIDELSNVNDAKQYAKDFSARFQESIERAVRYETESICDNINAKLQNFSNEMKTFVSSTGNSMVRNLSVSLVDTGCGAVAQAVNEFKMKYFTIVVFVAVGSIFGPIGSLIGFIAGLIAGIFMSKEEKLRKIKNESLNYLNKVIVAANTKLCVETEAAVTQVERIRRDIYSKSKNALREIYDNQKKIVDERVAALTQQIEADAQAKQKMRADTEELKIEWQPIHSHLKELKDSIESLKIELQVA